MEVSGGERSEGGRVMAVIKRTMSSFFWTVLSEKGSRNGFAIEIRSCKNLVYHRRLIERKEPTSLSSLI